MSTESEKPKGAGPAAGPPLSSAATESRRALEALAEVSQMVAGDLDVEAVLRSAMRAAATAMRAEACSILMLNRETNTLQFHIVEGPQTQGLAAVSVPIDDASIAGWVANHQEPLLVPDAYQDSRFNREYDLKTGFRTRSIISAPLVAKGKPVGVIQLLNRLDGESFDAEDLELARAVASLIAVAIHNAEEHRARVEAERLATVGQTIAGMAHCVKNILNGLRAGSYIIDQNMKPDTDAGVTRGWKMVKRNMQLLSGIVLDMLSYSKTRKPLYQECRIGDLCQDILNLLEGEAHEKTVELAARSAVEQVCIDEAGIRRCLINLVGNAIDACDKEPGRVEIKVEPVGKGDHFAIRVCDNGCGMPPETRAKIFQAFFSTKGGKGTGLGLAVTKKIVEEHGGSIRVESTAGVGTEFIMVLPARPPE